jgi:hypothetical protein
MPMKVTSNRTRDAQHRGGLILFVFGYLDAGSGSLLLQLLIGGIAGLATYARFRWHTIKGWLRKDPVSEE